MKNGGMIIILENIKVMNPDLDNSKLLDLFGTHDMDSGKDENRKDDQDVNANGEEGQKE